MVGWRIPKGFLILTRFRGCTSHFSFGHFYIVDIHSALNFQAHFLRTSFDLFLCPFWFFSSYIFTLLFSSYFCCSSSDFVSSLCWHLFLLCNFMANIFYFTPSKCLADPGFINGFNDVGRQLVTSCQSIINITSSWCVGKGSKKKQRGKQLKNSFKWACVSVKVLVGFYPFTFYITLWGEYVLKQDFPPRAWVGWVLAYLILVIFLHGRNSWLNFSPRKSA